MSDNPGNGQRFYRLLLNCCPASFRRRYQRELQSDFDELHAEVGARGGGWRFFPFYLRVTLDTLRQAFVEYRRPAWRVLPASTSPRSLVEDICSDIGYALKGFRRQPGFALLAIATLGIAIGANTTIFSVFNGVLLQSLPYPDPSRLVVIFNRYPTLEITRGRQSPGDFFDYRNQTDVFETLSAVGPLHPQTLTGLGEAVRIGTSSAFPDFFPMLGVEPVLGRPFTREDDPFKVLLGYGFWQSRFGGSSGVVGTTFRLNDNLVEVIGVLPPDFRLHLPGFVGLPTEVDVWLGMRYLGSGESPDRTAHWMTTVGRLKPGISLEQAQAQLDRVASWQRIHVPTRQERLAEIEVAPLHDEIVRDVEPTVALLLGAVGCLLLIGCVNVANLLLARGQVRRREVAIRAALGGGRARIARLLLTESLVLSLLAAALGLLLAGFGLKAVLAFLPASMPLTEAIELSWPVLCFATLLALTAVLIFGLAPALSTLGMGEAVTLRRPGSSGVGSKRVKSALIVAEVAISVVLLVSAGLMLRSFFALSQVSPGYSTANMLTFVVRAPDGATEGTDETEADQQFFRLAEETVAALPGVLGVGTIWPPPLGDTGAGASTYSVTEDEDERQSQIASSQLITPNYFKTLGIPILAGRTFTWEDRGDKLIIDERMARKMWPDASPLGKRLKIGWWSGARWGEVVGVVPNLRTQTLLREDPETVYRVAAVYGYSPQTFVVRTSGDPMEIAQPARRALMALHPGITVDEIRTLQSNVDRQLAPTRFVMFLIGGFAVIGLIFAAVGLYGVISYLVTQRTREMGIRLAFGAHSRQLLTMVLRQGMGWVALGLAIGLAGTLAVTRLLSSLLFGVEPGDPLTLIAVAAVLAAAAVPACLVPARRATRVDPLTSLRAD